MMEIFENINWVNFYTTCIAVCSVGISYFTLYENNKSNRRNIKYGKLEELLEIIKYINLAYPALKQSYKTLYKMEESKNYHTPDELYESMSKAFELQRGHLTNVIESKDKFYLKLGKAEILSKCYVVDEELSLEILCYIDLISSLAIVVYHDCTFENSQVSLTPAYIKMMKFVYHLETELIREMGLISNVTTRKKINQFKNHKFKERFDK